MLSIQMHQVLLVRRAQFVRVFAHSPLRLRNAMLRLVPAIDSIWLVSSLNE